MATKARNVWVLSLCETEKEAFEVLGAAVLDGYAADGVYDLDTAEKIGIEVRPLRSSRVPTSKA